MRAKAELESLNGGDDYEEDDGEREIQQELSRALRECERLYHSVQEALGQIVSSDSQGCITGASFSKGGGGGGGGNAARAGWLTQPECLSADCVLSDYQLVGLNWLWVMWTKRLGGILADEMGLGKTVQVIALFGALHAAGTHAGAHLVVAPASVLDNWMRELKRWCPRLRVAKYHGAQKDRLALQDELDHTGFDVLVTTYSYFEGDSEGARLDRQWLWSQRWGVNVFDEAHALKKSTSSRYQRLQRLKCEQRLLLTGTPVQNNIAELATMLAFMLPKIFRPQVAEAFAEREAARGAQRGAAEGDERRQRRLQSQLRRARRLLAPFVLRRTKNDVLKQLAPKTESDALVPMSDSQRSIYEATLAQARREAGGSNLTQKAAHSIFWELRKAALHPCLLRSHYGAEALAAVTRACHREHYFGRSATEKMVKSELATYSDIKIHQICTEVSTLRHLALSPSALSDSGKMSHLAKVLPELRKAGRRVLIFSQLHQMLDLLEIFLEGLELSFVRLDGDTPVAERQALIDGYQAPGSETFAFLLSTRAGGQGINLTSADTVVLHDLDWNPQLDRQAVDRAHRIGQTKTVEVIRLITSHSVDEAVYALQQKKATLDAQLLGSSQKSPRKRAGGKGGDKGGEKGGVQEEELDARAVSSIIHKMFEAAAEAAA